MSALAGTRTPAAAAKGPVAALAAAATDAVGSSPRYAVYGPLTDSANRNIYPKRILIMSPHPDDDVISMGGTFIRLVDQGHEVSYIFKSG